MFPLVFKTAFLYGHSITSQNYLRLPVAAQGLQRSTEKWNSFFSAISRSAQENLLLLSTNKYPDNVCVFQQKLV